MASISDVEFQRFARLLYEQAGIHLSERKKVMLATRLNRRLQHYGLRSFGQYFKLVTGDEHPEEMQVMIDHLTTNETHFFREPAHFDFLADLIKREGYDFCRVWCAASSSGEEVYTLAMVLDDALGMDGWAVLGSDISSRMLKQARRGVYPETDNVSIPERLLRRYCLQGVGAQAGNFAIDRRLKRNIELRQINLTTQLPSIGSFDLIFIRNVMIYFDQPTKHQVVKRAIGHLKPGGYILTSHSETLHGITPELEMIRPSIYRKLGHRER
ncbi:CheR family methyltransferase [Marinobacterium sediminicola]|uniref:Chemotaxis protein methyltransferase n=1 Tax=Marinobacterium sediminicola TaxID=518898 RepID=A0ABY1S3P7_9GAMM|nr:protein-glutamate O-methyltransferase CheR [Marinobacterium sediminicola]ULG68203.1 protein-glutamate O-methyltransferase CheR [Marinobacterium sediminicola]SMR77730.1 chemotaxis protein methyltransferase CheR [Marinobacterium sediminicola]